MLTPIVEHVDQEAGQPEELTPGPRRAAWTLLRQVLAVLALVAVFGGVLLVRTMSAHSKNPAAKSEVAGSQPAMPTSPAIEQKYGLRFTGVDVTSGGGMIQVRYQVLDSAKTEAIHDNSAAPYVVDGNGKKYADPGMVGHTHIGPVKASGTSDYVLLANATGGVKPGSIVTIKIGNLELRNVPVD